MIRAAVDTNGLVSAALVPQGNEDRVVDVVVNRVVDIHVTKDILLEYRAVPTRPKSAVATGRIAPLLTFIGQHAIMLEDTASPFASTDPTDAKSIACAVASAASYPVGDVLRRLDPRS